MAVTKEFEYNYTGGIFIDTTGRRDYDHDISLGIIYLIKNKKNFNIFTISNRFLKIII